jgi:hypothetical protein
MASSRSTSHPFEHPGAASATNALRRRCGPPAGAALALSWLGALSACGGGGGGGDGSGTPSTTGATPTSAATSAPGVADETARRTTIAEKLYVGVPRVPVGFFVETAPPGLIGPLATLHLLNIDLGASSPTPRHEVCSNDAAEALAWSEQRASWQGSYADLVETNASERLFEFVRVPRADTTARLRHRILRCGWLDRAATDLDLDSGAAGTLKSLPVGIEALRFASEYLWQFTRFNNADHVVLAAGAAVTPAGQAGWRIEMARLTRGTTTTDCDRVDRLAWTHVADAASGALTRRLESLETFRARRENGVVQLCTG